MEPRNWIEKAMRELMELLTMPSAQGDDALRAIALAGRIQESPWGLSLPDAQRQQLSTLIAETESVIPAELLGQLADALQGGDPPEGPLQDALLDIDDGVCSASLRGDEHTARRLSLHAAGMVETSPEGAMALGEFALMRLESTVQDAAIAQVWRSVAAAPGMIATELMPSANQDKVEVPHVLLRQAKGRARRTRTWGQIPSEVFGPEAKSTGLDISFSMQGEAERGFMSEVKGQLLLEVRLKENQSQPRRVQFEVRSLASGETLGVQQIPFRYSGRRIYADLGPHYGQGSVLAKLLPAGQNTLALYEVLLDVDV